MKRKIVTIFFVLICINFAFTETNGQYRNRIGRMPEEWDSLVKMQYQLEGEAFINLRNYMMGFSDAMYQACDYLYDTYGDIWFYNQYKFYFSESQNAIKDFGAGKKGHRRYYYEAGFYRVDRGSRRFTLYDF